MNRRVIYIGWINQGNLGDDLCCDIFKREFAAAVGKCSCSIEAASPQQLTANDFARNRPDLVVLGAGSLIHPYYLAPLLWAQEYGIPTAIWGSGVDGLPPDLVAALQAGDNPGKISLKTTGAKMIRLVVANCSLVGLRGPLTLAYLRTLGCSGRLGVCGDPGLLLGEAPLADDVKETSPVGRVPMIGLNWGTAHNRIYGGSEKETRRHLVKAIRELVLDYRVVLFAVWPPDLAPLRRLAEAAGGESEHLSFCRAIPEEGPLIALLSKCLFTINFKLHANVFTAAAGNPFICLGYRSKCFDFADSMKASALAVSTGAVDLAEQLLQRSSTVAADIVFYRGEIARRREHYRKKLRHLTAQCADLLDWDPKTKGELEGRRNRAALPGWDPGSRKQRVTVRNDAGPGVTPQIYIPGAAGLVFGQQHPGTKGFLVRKYGCYHTVPLELMPHYLFLTDHLQGSPYADHIYYRYLLHSWDFLYGAGNTHERRIARIKEFIGLYEAIKSAGAIRKPVVTCLRPDGRRIIVDGNHRAASALALGLPLPAEELSAREYLGRIGLVKGEFYGAGAGQVPYQCIFNGGEAVIAGRRPDLQERLDLIETGDLAERAVLDLGCNLGMSSFLAAARGARETLGVDRSPGLITAALRLNAYYALPCDFIVHDLNKPLPPERPFDTVFCFSLAAHLTNPGALAQTFNTSGAAVLYFEGHAGSGQGDYSCILNENLFSEIELRGYTRDSCRPKLQTRPFFRCVRK